jgi:hypothetical protein
MPEVPPIDLRNRPDAAPKAGTTFGAPRDHQEKTELRGLGESFGEAINAVQ